MKRKLFSVLLVSLSLFAPSCLIACTIFCAKDNNGNVWMGNNEDAAFSFRNYINVFPKSKNNLIGYYTLSRDKIENGSNAQIAGGMNEAGLSFDFNATQLYPVKSMYQKEEFPKGDDAILSYILGNFSHVEEVVAFFEKYWFQFGFRSAQMHLADKYGHFAMISPTGSQVLTNEPFQISTNFDICSKAESNNCWRFPIVQKALESEPPSLESFTSICQRTAQGRYTNYSTINNLRTGDINVFFAGDYLKPYKTTIKNLLERGKKSYSMEELFQQNAITIIYKTFKADGIDAAYSVYKKLNLSKNEKDILLPNLVDYFCNDINNYDIYPFLTEYTTDYSTEIDYWLVKSAIEYQKGNTEKSMETLKLATVKFPENKKTINVFKNRLIGEFEAGTTASFTLNGYSNAHFVIVKCKSMNSTFTPYDNITFLNKQKYKWELKMKLPDGIYDYTFIVDGKEILDEKTQKTMVKNLIGENVKCHELCIGFSEQTYPVQIEIEVPNKEDEVYITGNQESIFKAPLILMKRKSDFKRTISSNIHYPANFKFVTGAGQKEAIVVGADKNELSIVNSSKQSYKYKISGWK